MPTPRLTIEQAREVIAWVQECVDEGFVLSGTPSAAHEASRRHKVSAQWIRDRLKAAALYHHLEPIPGGPEPEVIERHQVEGLEDKVRTLLIQQPRTLSELVGKTSADIGQILDAIEALRDKGANLHRVGDRYEIPRHTEQAWTRGPSLEFKSDEHNRYLCGVVSDNHCASKYERRDVLADLYDRFAEAGVKYVFHCGNWIDGEARFNKHDLIAHGIEQQCQLLADTYPKREGITTYAVAGDDHEGWYAQREGIDVGRYAEGVMRNAGRQDWVHLGYMEAHIRLVNHNTKAEATMAVAHAGGGSTYALSYAVQKIIESLEGGEKPSVGFYGHYHKLWAGNIRNVWCLLPGCAQDQTPFMRKNKIEAHVAGVKVEMEQDPETGAIIGFTPDMKRYFARGYYSERWSHHGPVNQPERSIGGI